MKKKDFDTSDPIRTIGRYRIRRSRLREYLENIADGSDFNLFSDPRSNKMTNTWIKNNIDQITKAVGSSKAK
jgi:hypothetical protein